MQLKHLLGHIYDCSIIVQQYVLALHWTINLLGKV